MWASCIPRWPGPAGWTTRPSATAASPNPANLAIPDNAPTFEIENTEYGFHYAAMRRAPNAQGDMEVRNIRVVPLIMPTVRIIPAPNSFLTVFETPDNDYGTSTYIVQHGYSPPNRAEMLELLGMDDPAIYDPETRALTIDLHGGARPAA
ncbi:MAG: hypothetical protein ACE368_10290 [Paracoccaceae bacterium]